MPPGSLSVRSAVVTTASVRVLITGMALPSLMAYSLLVRGLTVFRSARWEWICSGPGFVALRVGRGCVAGLSG